MGPRPVNVTDDPGTAIGAVREVATETTQTGGTVAGVRLFRQPGQGTSDAREQANLGVGQNASVQPQDPLAV